MDLIERGYELMAEGKVERALACFGKVSERSPKGYFEIARCYEDGLGVEEDVYMAKKYFRLAIRQAKRIHEKNIRALRRRPKNRLAHGRNEMYRYAKVRDYLMAA